MLPLYNSWLSRTSNLKGHAAPLQPLALEDFNLKGHAAPLQPLALEDFKSKGGHILSFVESMPLEPLCLLRFGSGRHTPLPFHKKTLPLPFQKNLGQNTKRKMYSPADVYMPSRSTDGCIPAIRTAVFTNYSSPRVYNGSMMRDTEARMYVQSRADEFMKYQRDVVAPSMCSIPSPVTVQSTSYMTLAGATGSFPLMAPLVTRRR
jgi:hypothetical protein